MGLIFKSLIFLVLLSVFIFLSIETNINPSFISKFQLFEYQGMLTFYVGIFLIIFLFIISFFTIQKGSSKINNLVSYILIFFGVFIAVNIIYFLVSSEFKGIFIEPVDYEGTKRISYIIIYLVNFLMNFWEYYVLFIASIVIFLGIVRLKKSRMKIMLSN